MSLVAAFYWQKSPKCCISTLIFDDDTMEIVSSPKINYFPANSLSFKNKVKKCIKDFFTEINNLYHEYDVYIKIEFKIVFNVMHIPYLKPAKESKYVYKTFMYWLEKTKKRITTLKISSQLRKTLSGKPLHYFNRELKALHLVRRKKDTRFEYKLWAVALHATESNYEKKLKRVRNILLRQVWQ